MREVLCLNTPTAVGDGSSPTYNRYLEESHTLAINYDGNPELQNGSEATGFN